MFLKVLSVFICKMGDGEEWGCKEYVDHENLCMLGRERGGGMTTTPRYITVSSPTGFFINF